jgi:HlyD family secretion protein
MPSSRRTRERTTASNKKKRKKWLIYGGIGLALVLLIAGGLIAATTGSTKIDPTKLGKGRTPRFGTKAWWLPARVQPITNVEIKSKASGHRENSFIVDAGDKIKKGQLLAELDKEEIQAQVEQGHASLAASQASLTGAQADYERAKVDAEGPDVLFLSALTSAPFGMAKEGVVSASALEDAQKNYELALNKQNVAKAQLSVLKARIAQSQAQVARDQATLRQLEEQLSYTDIIAPIDGVLLSRDVEIGDAVSSISGVGIFCHSRP